jgi:cell division septum initiation protein DivIVA
MALTAEQIQAQIDELETKLASGVQSASTSDGKSVAFVDTDGLERRIAYLRRRLGTGARRNRIMVLRLRDD